MGTQCVIDIQNKYGESARLYHHFDGYPEDIMSFIKQVESWMKKMLPPSEYHLGGNPMHVASAFSQYELKCLKLMYAEAETEGQKWSNTLSPLGSFISIANCQSLNFNVWFDIEFYYIVGISENRWEVAAYKVMRDYSPMFEKLHMPMFTGLAHYKVFDEPLPYLLRCKICGDQCPIEMIERDHIIPKSKGGKGRRFNIRFVCANCHSYRHRYYNRVFPTG
jgi:hypothetical protein